MTTMRMKNAANVILHLLAYAGAWLLIMPSLMLQLHLACECQEHDEEECAYSKQSITGASGQQREKPHSHDPAKCPLCELIACLACDKAITPDYETCAKPLQTETCIHISSATQFQLHCKSPSLPRAPPA